MTSLGAGSLFSYRSWPEKLGVLSAAGPWPEFGGVGSSVLCLLKSFDNFRNVLLITEMTGDDGAKDSDAL